MQEQRMLPLTWPQNPAGPRKTSTPVPWHLRNAKAESHRRGLMAEAMAVEHLEEEGFQPLKQRYKTRYGEIDVIAEKDGMIVFIEVKMRARLEDALYSVTPRAQDRITRAAMQFLAENPRYKDSPLRFDVIAFAKDPKGGGILTRHLDNAW